MSVDSLTGILFCLTGSSDGNGSTLLRMEASETMVGAVVHEYFRETADLQIPGSK